MSHIFLDLPYIPPELLAKPIRRYLCRAVPIGEVWRVESVADFQDLVGSGRYRWDPQDFPLEIIHPDSEGIV